MSMEMSDDNAYLLSQDNSLSHSIAVVALIGVVLIAVMMAITWSEIW